MCRTECIVYIEVAKSSEFLGKAFFVLCFSSVKSYVFKKNCLAVFKSSNLCLCIFANDICCESYNAAEKFVKSVSYRLECELYGVILLCSFEKFCLCSSLFFSGKRMISITPNNA